jgi:N-acetylglucosaminyldiphosphoundecaprenol N-acetyl-beta-D-mannosaminyltransferase
MRRVSLFGIEIDNLTFDETLEQIENLLGQDGRHFVTTPNVDHIVRLSQDREFLDIYRRASLVVPDSAPLVWASRLLGKPLKERVAGSDLVIPVCGLAARSGRSVFLMGGLPGVAEKTALRLKERFPKLRVAGCYDPPRGFEKDPEENSKLVDAINRSGAEILFVALGAPKQEKWIAGHIADLNVKLALCVGAGLDFIAGLVRRAPVWMRACGIEWLWRLLQEPGRLWRRYLVDDMKFFKLLWHEWRNGVVLK